MDVGYCRYKREIQYNDSQLGYCGIGWLWESLLLLFYSSQERYTYEFIEKSGLSDAFLLGEANKKVHAILGSKIRS